MSLGKFLKKIKGLWLTKKTQQNQGLSLHRANPLKPKGKRKAQSFQGLTRWRGGRRQEPNTFNGLQFRNDCRQLHAQAAGQPSIISHNLSAESSENRQAQAFQGVTFANAFNGLWQPLENRLDLAAARNRGRVCNPAKRCRFCGQIRICFASLRNHKRIGHDLICASAREGWQKPMQIKGLHNSPKKPVVKTMGCRAPTGGKTSLLA